MDTGAKSRFGGALLLDLKGAGIRSIESIGSGYWIVAGPAADAGSFTLFHWSGKAGDAPKPFTGVDFKKHADFRPEALFAIPNTSLVQILSDDGGAPAGPSTCKELDAAKQTFRSIRVDIGKK